MNIETGFTPHLILEKPNEKGIFKVGEKNRSGVVIQLKPNSENVDLGPFAVICFSQSKENCRACVMNETAKNEKCEVAPEIKQSP